MTFCWVHTTPGLRTLIDSQCPWPPLWRARRLPKHRSALARHDPSRLSCWFGIPWRVKMHSFPQKVLSFCWLIYSIYLYLICHVSVLSVYLCMRTMRSLMLTYKVQYNGKKKQGRSCCTLATNILDDTCLGSNEAAWRDFLIWHSSAGWSAVRSQRMVLNRAEPAWQNDMCPSLPWLIKYLWLKLLSTVSGFQTVKVFFALYLLAKILTAGLLLESHSLNNENSAKNKDSGCWSCWIWPRWGDSDKETCI